MNGNKLLAGTALLWSAMPLVANKITGGIDEGPIAREIPQTVLKTAHAVRAAVKNERDAECQYVVRGLVEMFERGDKRVIPFRRICDPNYYLGSYSRPHLCEARVIVQTHFDLYDEALAVGLTFDDVFNSCDDE